MLKFLLIVSAAALAFLADDGWTKVRELKTGTELRVVKKGAKQPVLAKMDEATDENLIVILKNEQLAIAKSDIDRIDYRPSKSGRVTKETKTKTELPGDKGPILGRGYGKNGPTTTTSTGVSIGPKPDFETVYQRASPASK
ncbi:MAG: hypothetical protein M3Z23_05950 [Acidobacteriota bacterium]|nr:hypothetical protein [Acidobacteriota bacterium]